LEDFSHNGHKGYKGIVEAGATPASLSRSTAGMCRLRVLEWLCRRASAIRYHRFHVIRQIRGPGWVFGVATALCRRVRAMPCAAPRQSEAATKSMRHRFSSSNGECHRGWTSTEPAEARVSILLYDALDFSTDRNDGGC
jgi:hypothetical protein